MSDRDAAEAGTFEPSVGEALRLVIAFSCIMEPEKRAMVLAFAERYANEPNSQGGALVAEERGDGS